MSFEDKLNQRLMSEAASLDDVRAAAAKRGLRKPQPKEFADVRKAMRRPMTTLDAAIHQIDQFLNTTQQDPSRLDSTVAEIEKAFNNIFEPLRAIRSGIQNLRLSANTMKTAGFEYAGQNQGQQPQQAKPLAKTKAPGVMATTSPDEDRFMNRVATDVEMSNRPEDKRTAVKQGFEAYKQQGGKMNHGEFVRALVQKLRLPGEAQEQQTLPSATGSKQYGPKGTRRGELQYKQGRTSPIESSVQRRKSISEYHNLGQLPRTKLPNEDQLLNKIVTNIEMVNNPRDKQTALRDGWLEYQTAGGMMGRDEFAAAIKARLTPGQR